MTVGWRYAQQYLRTVDTTDRAVARAIARLIDKGELTCVADTSELTMTPAGVAALAFARSFTPPWPSHWPPPQGNWSRPGPRLDQQQARQQAKRRSAKRRAKRTRELMAAHRQSQGQSSV